MTPLKNQKLRIAIFAPFLPGRGHGGVESVIIGLVTWLGKLDGPEEYVIIGPEKDPEWLKPHAGPNQKFVSPPHLPARSKFAEMMRLSLKSIRPLWRQIKKELIPEPSSWPEMPISNGFYEGLGCDIIHFPYQAFVLCALPAIYNPHDIQHLHYPQFFNPDELAWRETILRKGCQIAKTVVVASQWVKEDIIKNYSINQEKIQVIPFAPPTNVFPEPTEEGQKKVLSKYRVKTPFALYPAATWPHKNHIRLMEALALLKNRNNLAVKLICTGNKTEFWPQIKERISALGLENEVQFLGIIPAKELRALYKTAQFVIIPTLFEAASGPLFEAWQEGVPAACSNVTSLPEQAGDGALIFNPFSTEDIAETIFQMVSDSKLREELIKNGNKRLQNFSWEKTAKTYRAIYRQTAGYPLTEEELFLLGKN